MAKFAAGLLMHRRRGPTLEVFLVHPGGPFWVNKDLGSWGIPKGEYTDEENPFDAAKREFQEETGFTPDGDFVALGALKQPSGKTVIVWAVEGDCDPSDLKSNTCMIEWPPRSGQEMEIPEVDRGAWFNIDDARTRILKGQAPFLDRLLEKVGVQEAIN
jgi:predicted NUDIX family NTP pyrophosphohydrolase